ncbi:hypothetical protein HNR44_003422 [Geomicrobium halophilum]|uniref:Glyoxalase-like domain-containing protein n=1 Tax=Geomicrobium halophilum TaxID=549000 RepID=A0A841Q190_9BACL|nr:VOC family protein [Geomicrobium halophilum]MBB6451415.1 hypothetical protein [Geomicrobium halophilum]
MDLYFDHLVHFSQNPTVAVKDFQTEGLNAFPGGRHEKWGTYNSVCYFGLSYIEFLGIEDMNQAKRAIDNDLVRQAVQELSLESNRGMSRLAFRTNHLQKWARHFEKTGVRVDGIHSGQRKKEDGSFIEWSMLFPKSQSGLELPFFIEWQQ